ncbi:MAG TPA: hypothetical protein VGR88_09825 [Ktedonobacterales bacterium]|nr:hypothetical protein [Ktedonobacterales bacterium]
MADGGEAVSAVGINLIRQGSGAPGLPAQSTGVNSAGEFSFDGLVPGDYFLEAKPAAAGDRILTGWQTISIGNEDGDRVLVEMEPGIQIAGKIVADGKPPGSWPQITLTPTEGLNYLDSPMIDGEGHFSLAALEPAPYRVTVGAVPPPMFVKSVRFNGHDIDDDVDLTSAPAGSLDIVISDRASSSITGVVSETSSVASPSVRAVAVPTRTQGRVPSARVDAGDDFPSTVRLPESVF